MPFCANCGSAVEGQFCGKCGSPAAAPAGAGAQQAAAPTMAPANAMTDNAASALCYVLGLITGIIFLVMAPYNQNKNVRFHAFQSIFLHVAMIAVWFVADFLLVMMHMWMFTPLIGLACLAVWVYIIVRTWQGAKIVLPLVGQLAQQQA